MSEYRRHFWPQPSLLRGTSKNTKMRADGINDTFTNSYMQSVEKVDYDSNRTGGSTDLLQALQDAHEGRKYLTREKAFVIFGSVLLARAAVLLEYLQSAPRSRYLLPRALLNLQFELIKEEDVFLLLSQRIAAQFTHKEIADTFVVVKDQISLLLPPDADHSVFSIVIAWPSEAYPHDQADGFTESHHYILPFILGNVPRGVIPSCLQELDEEWSSVLKGHVVHLSMEDGKLAKDVKTLLQCLGAKIIDSVRSGCTDVVFQGTRIPDWVMF
ncbi:hypothetical protein V5O48_012869, partial [Marasmius crinis-equi]